MNNKHKVFSAGGAMPKAGPPLAEMADCGSYHYPKVFSRFAIISLDRQKKIVYIYHKAYGRIANN